MVFFCLRSTPQMPHTRKRCELVAFGRATVKKATATDASHWGIYRVLRTQAFLAPTRMSAPAPRGFTLIEIAIVLVVIGLITSGGLLAVSPVIQSAKISETKQKMATIDSAILGYVITNGCMPCPAVRGAAATGLSQNTGGTYTGGCNTSTCAVTATSTPGEGLVPWVTLGLSANDATDGWNRRFTFGVDPTRTVAGSMQRNADGSFPTFTSTIVIQGVTGVASLGYTSVLYAIVSHGSDGAFGESSSGLYGADTHGGTAGEGQPENGDFVDLRFASGSVIATGATYFDDIVTFKSFQTLILNCGAGSCGNPS